MAEVVAAEAREPSKPLNLPPREIDLHLRVSLRLDLEARPKHAAASRLELIHDRIVIEDIGQILTAREVEVAQLCEAFYLF